MVPSQRNSTLVTAPKTAPPLTPEQRAFSAVLGEILAQIWIQERDQSPGAAKHRNSQEGNGPPISAACRKR